MTYAYLVYTLFFVRLSFSHASKKYIFWKCFGDFFPGFFFVILVYQIKKKKSFLFFLSDRNKKLKTIKRIKVGETRMTTSRSSKAQKIMDWQTDKVSYNAGIKYHKKTKKNMVHSKNHDTFIKKWYTSLLVFVLYDVIFIGTISCF